jgi:hypothetical protein
MKFAWARFILDLPNGYYNFSKGRAIIYRKE